ncbi:MAG: NnrS family protein [Rhodobacteraceae bacterium]|nr:NnrS family protein [Paracoccaceae bacterium]
MTTSSEQMRTWNGPALLTFGFRPFFLGAGLWAASAMTLWLLMLSGAAELPTRFDPVTWHAHELLFGYLGAVIAGFLLTAVPNWTGRLPVVGWPLGILFLLWVIGRIAIAVAIYLPVWSVALADLAMPVVLVGVLTREIVTGKNWRNLIVLGMLITFTLANATFHWQAATGAFAAGDLGLRAGLGAGIMMIAVIGGRIIPSFTRNWLVKRRETRLPTPPMQRFDRAALLILLVALLFWVVSPENLISGAILIAAGVTQAIRLVRWAGRHTLSEPLVWVLHAGYAFLALGALALGFSTFWPGLLTQAAAQHVWMAGAIGLMTLAVMTRATLGHTGQTLTAGTGTRTIYLGLIGAVLARLIAGLAPGAAGALYAISGLCWIAAFGGFAILYGPLLVRPRMTT